MIHARIDTVEHRQIVGFEIGTRQAFDRRHAGDPLWIFIESYRVKFRANFANFMQFPRKYKVLDSGDIAISNSPPIITPDVEPDVPIGYAALKGRDGRYLTTPDGIFILGFDGDYTPPPAGTVYLIDPDGALLKDPDGRLLNENS